MVHSWKTTASAAVTALCMFIFFSPETFYHWPWLIQFAKFAAVGGLVSFGVSAKDFNVSGGTAPVASVEATTTVTRQTAYVEQPTDIDPMAGTAPPAVADTAGGRQAVQAERASQAGAKWAVQPPIYKDKS
jgi:hypothetical protein